MQQGFLARLEIIDLSKLEQLIYLVDKREIDTLMKPNFTFLSHDIITRQLRNLHRQATNIYQRSVSVQHVYERRWLLKTGPCNSQACVQESFVCLEERVCLGIEH